MQHLLWILYSRKKGCKSPAKNTRQIIITISIEKLNFALELFNGATISTRRLNKNPEQRPIIIPKITIIIPSREIILKTRALTINVS